MLYLVLSILLSVVLLLNFRLFPRFGINTFQAIVFNYPVCFLTGFLLLPEGQSFSLDWQQTWTWLSVVLGVGFIVTFLLSGFSTQRVGMTATSLANNMSLVVPVCVSLFLLGTSQSFDWLNYLGLFLALIAVGLSTFKPNSGSTQPSDKRLNTLLPISVFLMYGVTNTMINYINWRYITDPSQTVAVTLTMVLGAIIAGMLTLGYRLFSGKEKLAWRNIAAAFTLGIPNFLSFYTLLKALSAYQNNGAFVYPLYNIGVILAAALMGLVVFREKLSLLNTIGLLLSVVAITLLSYQALI